MGLFGRFNSTADVKGFNVILVNAQEHVRVGVPGPQGHILGHKRLGRNDIGVFTEQTGNGTAHLITKVLSTCSQS